MKKINIMHKVSEFEFTKKKTFQFALSITMLQRSITKKKGVLNQIITTLVRNV